MIVAIAAIVAGAAAARWYRVRAHRAEAEAVTLRRKVLAEQRAARQDALTGLFNRRAFYEFGELLLSDVARRPLVAIMVDLDEFRKINDTLGHVIADEVLVVLGRRFADYTTGHLAARLGADEFVALVPGSTKADGTPYPSAPELTKILSAPIWASGHWVRISASVGVAAADGTADLGKVLRRADAVMRRAKIVQRRAMRAHPTAPAEFGVPTGHEQHGSSGHRGTLPVYCRTRAVARRRRRA
jgi:diguanylate cyclase (GGDEF)-like protein